MRKILVLLVAFVPAACDFASGNIDDRDLEFEALAAQAPGAPGSGVIRNLAINDVFISEVTVTTPEEQRVGEKREEILDVEKVKVVVDGEETEQIVDLNSHINLFNETCKTFDTLITLNDSENESISDSFLYFQGDSNTYYDCGRLIEGTEDSYKLITDSATIPNGIFLRYESPLTVGDITSGVVFYSDSSWEDCTITVQAQEQITVPAGTFDTYRITETCSRSDGAFSEAEVWLSPILGWIVKSRTEENGTTIETRLTSTTVPIEL